MNVASIIGAAAAGCVVLGYIAKVCKAAYEWCQKLGKAMEQVKDRSAQLEPNGGSSIKDAVTRIEAHLKAQDLEIAELKSHAQPPPRRWRR